MIVSKLEISANNKARVSFAEVLSLCLVECEKYRPLRVSRIWKEPRYRRLSMDRGNEILRQKCPTLANKMCYFPT